MTVRKYRSIADFEDTGSVDPSAPNFGRVVSDVWAFSARLARAAPLRGVRRFRTIGELNDYRREWEARGRDDQLR